MSDIKYLFVIFLPWQSQHLIAFLKVSATSKPMCFSQIHLYSGIVRHFLAFQQPQMLDFFFFFVVTSLSSPPSQSCVFCTLCQNLSKEKLLNFHRRWKSKFWLILDYIILTSCHQHQFLLSFAWHKNKQINKKLKNKKERKGKCRGDWFLVQTRHLVLTSDEFVKRIGSSYPSFTPCFSGYIVVYSRMSQK